MPAYHADSSGWIRTTDLTIMSRAPPCKRRIRVGTRGKKSLENERLKPRSVGRVLPLVFALVDPWWTLRDVVKRTHRARLDSCVRVGGREVAGSNPAAPTSRNRHKCGGFLACWKSRLKRTGLTRPKSPANRDISQGCPPPTSAACRRPSTPSRRSSGPWLGPATNPSTEIAMSHVTLVTDTLLLSRSAADLGTVSRRDRRAGILDMPRDRRSRRAKPLVAGHRRRGRCTVVGPFAGCSDLRGRPLGLRSSASGGDLRPRGRSKGITM
jgi:hypothetical protein